MTTPGSRTYVRRGVGRSSALALLALVAFVALVIGVEAAWRPRTLGPLLIPLGVLLALIPAALWLLLFYIQDRYEPEPKADVARIFVTSLALGGAIGLPLVQQVFRLPDWQYRDAAATILGAIFIAGAVEAFIVYAAVRYFIFYSPQFNERTDGVIYGVAAGLGYATARNVQFILASGGAALGAAEVNMAAVALGGAALGGTFGYFLGRARLEREPLWWLSAGLILTAVLSGLFSLARTLVEPGRMLTGNGVAVPSVAGLAASVALASLVAGAVGWLIRCDTALALSGRRPAPPADAAVGDRAANLTVIGVLAVCLIIGGLVWQYTVNGVTAFDVAGFRGHYPAHFSLATRPDDVLRVRDFPGTEAEFSIGIVTPSQAPPTGRSAVPLLTTARARRYDVYRVLGSEETDWKGRPALIQRFAAVERPTFETAVPQVVEGTDYIILDGDRAVVVTMTATSATYASVESSFLRFVDDLTF
jgi:RsiW-degrading membrane proteinase PrsW (M82 family)